MEGHGFSRAVKSIAIAGFIIATEVRFFPSEIAGESTNNTSGAKALKNASQCGTAEAVPFRGRVLP
jgi:hypothetical protein